MAIRGIRELGELSDEQLCDKFLDYKADLQYRFLAPECHTAKSKYALEEYVEHLTGVPVTQLAVEDPVVSENSQADRETVWDEDSCPRCDPHPNIPILRVNAPDVNRRSQASQISVLAPSVSSSNLSFKEFKSGARNRLGVKSAGSWELPSFMIPKSMRDSWNITRLSDGLSHMSMTSLQSSIPGKIA